MPTSEKSMEIAASDSTFLTPPGHVYHASDLQRQFLGMGARDVYVLMCKRNGCKPNTSVIGMLPERHGVWDVQEIDLSKTLVGARGVIPIMETAKLFPSLTTISFSNNYLTNDSVWHICKVLHHHPSVTKLDLSNNTVSWTAGMCCLELVTKNVGVQKIVLDNTLVKPKVVESINAQIRKNIASGSRNTRKGPNPSNHPTTIRQRALRRYFRDLVLKEGNKSGRVPRALVAEGYKELMKLSGRELELQNKSPAFFDDMANRCCQDTIDWDCFMIVSVLDDVLFNQDQVDLLRSQFNTFDVDGTGFIEAGEISEVMTVLNHGTPPSDAEVKAKMDLFALDVTMTLTWDEFLLLMYDRGPEPGQLGTFATQTPLKRKASVHH